MDIGDWISAAGVAVSVVSAAGAGVAWWKARGEKAEAADQAKRATKAAEDAAAASSRAAEAAERSATAHEEQLRIAEEQISAEERAPWRIERTGGMAWDIHNTTPTPKYHVDISGPAIVPSRQSIIEVIDGHSSADIPGAFIASGSDDRLTVKWHRRDDLSDGPLQWTGRLPSWTVVPALGSRFLTPHCGNRGTAHKSKVDARGSSSPACSGASSMGVDSSPTSRY
jgi:hypothetical protein